MYYTEAGTYNLKLDVKGPAAFSVATAALSLVVRNNVEISVTIAPIMYVGTVQSLSVKLAAPPRGALLNLSLRATCAGKDGGLTFAAEQHNFSGFDVSWTVNATATSPCSSVTIGATLAGATFYNRPPSTFVAVLEKINLTATYPSVVYIGGTHSPEILLTASLLPRLAEATFCVVKSSPALTLTQQSVKFLLSGSPLVQTVGCSSTTGPLGVVTVRVSSASSEYVVVNPEFNVSVLQTLAVNYTATPSTMYVGEMHSRVVSVWLPTPPPEGQFVVVTPTLTDGSLDIISFRPSSVTLSSATPFANITVVAIGTTSTGNLEKIKLVVTGNSFMYLPVPSIIQWPILFRALGRVVVDSVPSALYLGKTDQMSVSVSFLPPTGYSSVVLSVSASSTAVSISPRTVEWNSSSSLSPVKVSLTGNSLSSAVNISFSVTAPDIYYSAASITSAMVSVLDDTAIFFPLPAYIYIGLPYRGAVSVQKLPDSPNELILLFSTGGGTSLSFQPPSLTFSFNSAQSIEFALEATAAGASTVSVQTYGGGSVQIQSPCNLS